MCHLMITVTLVLVFLQRLSLCTGTRDGTLLDEGISILYYNESALFLIDFLSF